MDAHEHLRPGLPGSAQRGGPGDPCQGALLGVEVIFEAAADLGALEQEGDLELGLAAVDLDPAIERVELVQAIGARRQLRDERPGRVGRRCAGSGAWSRRRPILRAGAIGALGTIRGTATLLSRCRAVCFLIASTFSAWLRCRFFCVNPSEAVSEIEPVIVSLLRKTSARLSPEALNHSPV